MAAGDHLGVQFDLPTNRVRFLGLPISKYSGERGSKEYQQRLVDHIKNNGIQNPIQVRRVDNWSSLAGEENYKGPATHIVRDGAHRLAAAKQLKLKTVPVVELK